MTQNEKKLLQQFRNLTENQRETLLDFAAFLATREEVAEASEPAQPVPMERPAQESVAGEASDRCRDACQWAGSVAGLSGSFRGNRSTSARPVS